MTGSSLGRALAHELVVVPCLLGLSLPLHIIYALVLGLDNDSPVCRALFFAFALLIPNIDEVLTDGKTKNCAVRVTLNLSFFILLAWTELWILDSGLIRKNRYSLRPITYNVLEFGRSILYLTFAIRASLLSLRAVLHPLEEILPAFFMLMLGLTFVWGAWIPFACVLIIAASGLSAPAPASTA